MEKIVEHIDERDDFEELIRRRLETKAKSQNMIAAHKASKSNYTKAQKGASVDDFITMVRKIVTKTMRNDHVEFLPDDDIHTTLDQSGTPDHPMILYTIVSRVPRADNPKPKFRENIKEYDDNGKEVRQGSIWGQLFDCDIQFNIVASDYTIASRVMNTFEDAMFKFTGYFKQNGVSELLFKKQYTDSSLDRYRQNVSIRSIIYRATIEKIHLVFDTTIAEIDQSYEK